MERCFVKFPTDVVHLEAAPAVGIVPGVGSNHFSLSNTNIAVSELTEQQKDDIRSAGAQVYSDFQFHPVSDAFDPGTMGAAMRFWETTGVLGPAGPEPWQGKGLADVLAAVSVPDAWSKSKGDGVTIAIVDSGINGLANEFPLARRSSVNFAPAYVNEGAWIDQLGHGSMVAAIAAGSKGVLGKYDGVAPNSRILSARTNYRATDLYLIYDRLIAARRDGRLGGPVVVNNSYAVSRCAPEGVLVRDHPYAEIARSVVHEGMTMIFAAGNNHADLLCGNNPNDDAPNSIWAVNSMDEMITVGAVNWDFVNTVGAHSNSSRGPGEWSTVLSKPDLVAPCYGEVLWGQSYRTLDWWGTSGAAPVVTGVAALMLARAAENGKQLAPSDVGDILRRCCDPLPLSHNCVGQGLVNAKQALQIVDGL